MIWGGVNDLVPVVTLLGLFFLGLISFSLVEYLIHRYVFHMEPDTEFKEKMQYNFHGIHHDFPKDKDRLAMPPIVSSAISATLFLVFYLIIGNYAFGFIPGFLMGYLCLSWRTLYSPCLPTSQEFFQAFMDQPWNSSL